jgi:hypothetical protein
LPPGSDVDWDKALDIALHARDAERKRLEHIEGKIAPIIAGTIAGLGLFIQQAASLWDYLGGALLLVPLIMLFRAFATFEYDDVPNLEELKRTYEWYPSTFKRAVVFGAADVVAKNRPAIDSKAQQLNHAMVALFLAVVIILAVRLGEVIVSGKTNLNPAAGAGGGAVSSPAAADTGTR